MTPRKDGAATGRNSGTNGMGPSSHGIRVHGIQIEVESRTSSRTEAEEMGSLWDGSAQGGHSDH